MDTVRPRPPAAKPRRHTLRGRAAALVALAWFAAISLAAEPAARAENDGTYGRFDGDLELRAGAGATFAAGGPALCARLALSYLSTAGLYLHYSDALGIRETQVARSIAGGVLLQPLFLGRYGNDLEHGPPRLDLLLDSVGLGVGAFWEARPGAGLAADPGLELSLSLDVPLLEDATGPFIGLRGALRWRAPELAGQESARDEQRALLSVTLGWHHITRAHLVDASDRARARRRGAALAQAGDGQSSPR